MEVEVGVKLVSVRDVDQGCLQPTWLGNRGSAGCETLEGARPLTGVEGLEEGKKISYFMLHSYRYIRREI